MDRYEHLAPDGRTHVINPGESLFGRYADAILAHSRFGIPSFRMVALTKFPTLRDLISLFMRHCKTPPLPRTRIQLRGGRIKHYVHISDPRGALTASTQAEATGQ